MAEKKKPHFINGIRGAISLFMAVLLTPFLTIAMLLVETGRYNSAASILDEAMGISSFSTLTNYDSYLHDRWGLLGLDQKIEYENLLKNYLTQNAGIMGSSLLLDTMTAEGEYALSDPQILRSQIMEFCKLNAPMKLATELGDLSDLIKRLEGLRHFGDYISMIGKGADVLDAQIKIAEAVDELKKIADELDGYNNSIPSSYSEFAQATNKVILELQEQYELENNTIPAQERTVQRLYSELSALQAEQAAQEAASSDSDSDKDSKKEKKEKKENPAIKEKEEAIKREEDNLNGYKSRVSQIKSNTPGNRAEAIGKQAAYAKLLDDIAAALDQYATTMSSCMKTVDTVRSDVVEIVGSAVSVERDKAVEELEETQKNLNKDLDAMEKEGFPADDSSYQVGLDMKEATDKKIAEIKTYSKIDSAMVSTVQKSITDWDSSTAGYSEVVLRAIIGTYTTMAETVRAVDIGALTRNSPYINQSTYEAPKATGYLTGNDIDKYVEAQSKALKESKLEDTIDALVNVYNQLMGLTVFFEDSLSASIDVGYFNNAIGGLPGSNSQSDGPLAMIQSLGNALTSAKNLKNNFTRLKWLEALRNLFDLWTSFQSFLQAVASFALGILSNLAGLFTGYDRLYLGTYSAYELGCRTDFKGGKMSVKAMTGYSVGSDSFSPARNNMNVPVFGEMAQLVSMLISSKDKTGGDKMFNGAEMEYVLLGSYNEVANQIYVFIMIYLVRLLFSISSVLANGEIQAIAGASTLGYPIVMGLFVVLEPLAETILIANGKTQPLLTTSPYLAPSKLPNLVNQLFSAVNITESQGESIVNKMLPAIKVVQEDYDYQKKLLEYRDEQKKENNATNAPVDSSQNRVDVSEKDKNFGDELKKAVKPKAFGLSYREYCLFLVMLTVKDEQLFARLSNLIQMETMYYYSQKDGSFVFNLNDSYTFLKTTATGSVKQSLPSLISPEKFKLNRTLYRGY